VRRLNAAVLEAMQLTEPTPQALLTPSYAPQDHGIGIVHLGIGAFHRAHQAVYMDDILACFGGNWRIMGVSLRSSVVRNQLEEQDGLYALAVMDQDQTTYRIVGSVAGVLTAQDDPETVLDLMARSSIKIYSLTVTEKGYYHDPATCELNESHPDIRHDLGDLTRPKTTIGYLVAALRRRYRQGTGPVTILSCDNLPDNGNTVRKIVLQFARNIDRRLATWIEQSIAFPCTMVDRIVPATTQKDLSTFATTTGFRDEGLVKSESFTQWVVEDQFACGRPPFDKVGVLLVDDVSVYEEAKLRMLNGSHSALAYLGFLGGYEFIHEVMGNPCYRSFADCLIGREAATSLRVPDHFDPDTYRCELLERYDNAALQHRTYQIAMDGSQKLPQRLLATLAFHLANDGPIDACALAVAGWMRYVSGFDEQGNSFPVQDPMAQLLQKIAARAGTDSSRLVADLLRLDGIFEAALRTDTRLVKALCRWTGLLLKHGSRKTLDVFESEYML